MSQAILFSSVLVFLLLAYVLGGTSSRRPTAVGVLLALSSVALVLHHPQLAAHFIAVFVGICTVQFVYRRYRPRHPIANHRPLYGQTVALVTAFLVWTSNHGFFSGVIRNALLSFVEYFVGDAAAASRVTSQSASLTEIGAGVGELFVKLFAPSLVFAGLTGLLLCWAVLESGSRVTERTNGVLPYFFVSLAGLSAVFTLYFVGSISEMYFRVFGLIMLLATISGAVAIAYGASTLSVRIPRGVLHGVVVVGFGLLLVSSLVVVFPSPYIYKASPHVTEATMAGHELAFDHVEDEREMTGIRAGPNRYVDAIHGSLDRTDEIEGVTGEEVDAGLADEYDDRYLVVTRSDWEREVIAYQELRYSYGQLDSIAGQRGVDRVQSNGEFALYYIHGEGEAVDATGIGDSADDGPDESGDGESGGGDADDGEGDGDDADDGEGDGDGGADEEGDGDGGPDEEGDGDDADDGEGDGDGEADDEGDGDGGADEEESDDEFGEDAFGDEFDDEFGDDDDGFDP